MKGQLFKGLATDLINAIGFIIALGLFVSVVGMLVGEGFKDINITTLGESASLVFENPLLLGVSFLFFVGVGALVFIFGKYVRPQIGKMFGVKEPESDITTNKKAYLATFFLTGIITVVILSAFGSFLTGLNEDVNIVDMSTLVNALSSSSPEFWVVFVLGLIGLGMIVGFFGRHINSIREGIPDRFAKV